MNELDYGLILQSLSEGVCCFNREGIINCFNHAAESITGYPAEEALNRRFDEIFCAEGGQCQSRMSAIMHHGQRMQNVTTRIRTRSGVSIPVRVNAAPLYHSGRISGAVLSFLDYSEVENLRRELTGEFSRDGIIGKSQKIRELVELLPNIGESGAPVIILGESGTGKELFARAIHEYSRRTGNFVAVNCGALPEELLESELFGHVKGAFTGAVKDRPGRFARAENGTLFLDEIGEISQAMQVKLLRVLQEKEYEPLGGTKPIHSDVRIIAATNRDLKQLVNDGSFRQDLYFRLNVVELTLPALRERREDIPLLAEYFINMFNAEKGKNVQGLSREALAGLMAHNFPGNIRELGNVIERAYVICPGNEIGASCIAFTSGINPPGGQPPSGPCPASVLTPPAGVIDQRHNRLQPEEEKALILQALERNRGHRRNTADELGVNPSTLWRKMKRYGIH